METFPEAQPEREMAGLELALLRRAMNDRDAQREVCALCRRTPLVGERVYLVESGTMLCELCRPQAFEIPVRPSTVHGPEYGHTLRVSDQRAA